MQNSPQDFRNKVLGRSAEELTAKYLKKHGYKIIERNYKTPYGEADIIAFKDGYYCFVEVKARASDAFGLPSEAVNERKRERYRKIALYFCMTKKREVPCRFDVASILEGNLEYFENAYY
ncbi:MAG: YraN family protein [Clostridiales bacterium]|nr:YraN family protein [Clostridiales bacterium]